MEQRRKKQTYLVSLTVFSFITGIIGALLLNYGWPDLYFETYPFIPLYFYIFGFVLIHLFERVRKKMQHKALFLYVGIRMIKLLVSIVVLVIYGLVYSHIKEFMLTFIVFYLLFLIFDTYFFFKFEVNEIKRLQGDREKNEKL